MMNRLIAAVAAAFLMTCSPTAEEPGANAFFEVSGPHEVGTKTAHTDLPGAPDRSPRPVVIQLWYPTDTAEGLAPYFPDGEILNTLVGEEYYFQSAENLASWRDLRVPATLDAAPLSGGTKFPILLLSPGLGVVRNNYSRMAADLASWGYVVVSIDHLYNGPLRTAGGEIILASDDPDAKAPDFDRMTVERADDLSGVIELLQNGNLPELADYTAVMDIDRIGALGHSMGGVVAFEACATQVAVLACVNMDGAPQASFPETGIGKPVLFLKSDAQYSDEELVAKGRDPEEWKEMGNRFRTQWRAIFDLRQGTVGNYLTVHGTGHMSFSDAPHVMPDTITRFGGDLTNFETASGVVSTTLRRFFDAFLKNASPFDPDHIRQETTIVY